MGRRIPGALFLLGAIFVFAFLLRAMPLQEYHGWDEAAYLQHAEYVAFGKENYDEWAFRPPLLPLILAAAFRAWHSIYFADIIVALLSAAITIPLYFIGKRLHGDAAGLFAAFIAAVHPAFVTYGHLILTDTLVATLLAFALLFLFMDDWKIVIAGAFAGLGMLMKFTAAGAVPAMLLFIAMKEMPWKRRITQMLLFCAGLFVLILPYLVWVQQRYGIINFFAKSQSIVNAVNGGPFYYLHPEIFIAPLLAGVVLAGIYWRRIPRQYIILAALWLVLIIGYLYRFPNRELRYALAAIVPLIVLAGTGYALYIERIRMKALVGIIILVLIMATSVSSLARLREPPVNHWKSPTIEMAQYINTLDRAKPLYATTAYPIYGYYTQNPVVVVDGPYFIPHMRALMPEDGYLIVTADAARMPTIEWADQQYDLKKIKEIEGIALYEYDAR